MDDSYSQSRHGRNLESSQAYKDMFSQMYGLDTPKIMFCPECNNMLYPRESKEEKCLVYFCRACLYQQKCEKQQSCTYNNKITHEINELALIPPEVIQDPCLARTKLHPCPKCDYIEAVFMQGSLKETTDAMRLYYVCCNPECRFKWTE